MIDKEKIQNKLRVIGREKALLETYKGYSFEEFSEDITLYYSALHSLQVALQACLDICQYIAAHELLPDYKETKEVFKRMADKKILSKVVAEKFEKAIGVRNILVHQYEDVDPKIIYNLILSNLSDFDEFIREIAKYDQSNLF